MISDPRQNEFFISIKVMKFYIKTKKIVFRYKDLS